MPKDPTAAVRTAIADTERLIRQADGDTDEGKDAYVADLKRHLEKLRALLGKHDERRRADEARYGKAT